MYQELSDEQLEFVVGGGQGGSNNHGFGNGNHSGNDVGNTSNMNSGNTYHSYNTTLSNGYFNQVAVQSFNGNSYSTVFAIF